MLQWSNIFVNEPDPGSVLKNWSWIGIIFDWMILLRIFVFQNHLKGNFLSSQQLVIVYEVSWLNFDMYFFIMYIMCQIIFEEKAEIQHQHPLSLNRDRDWDRLQKYWAIGCICLHYLINSNLCLDDCINAGFYGHGLNFQNISSNYKFNGSFTRDFAVWTRNNAMSASVCIIWFTPIYASIIAEMQVSLDLGSISEKSSK